MAITEERIYQALAWIFLAAAAYLLLTGRSDVSGYCGVALAINALIKAGRLEREVKVLRATSDRSRT